jgi:hypothetical protein
LVTQVINPYLIFYPRQDRNLCSSPVNDICSTPDPRWDNFRDNLGYILRYSRKLNLAAVNPSHSICSTGFCLAQNISTGAKYLVYFPTGGQFTIDLSAVSDTRKLEAEWFNPATGSTIPRGHIASGQKAQSFIPPFTGDAVLYLVDTKGHRWQFKLLT